MNLKINKFKDTKSATTKLFAIILSDIHLDVHFSTKSNIFTFYKGVWVFLPQNPKLFLKKSKVRFLKFIVYFWARLPKSL